jgi:Flp pilus assembly protein TadG
MRWKRGRHRLAKAFRLGLWRARDGAAAAEFAAIVPVLALLLAGIWDVAQLADQGLSLTAAVRAGANFAQKCSYDDSSLNINCTGMTGSPSNTTICGVITGETTDPCNSTAVTVSFLNAGESAGTTGYPQWCTCEDGSSCSFSTNCSSGIKQAYITIKATETVSSSLFNWVWHFGSTTIICELTVRVS